MTAVERSVQTAADTLRTSRRTSERAERSAVSLETFAAAYAADTVRDSVGTLLVVDTAGRVIYRERTLWHDSRRRSEAATATNSQAADTVRQLVATADTVRTAAKSVETAASRQTVTPDRPWYKKALETLGGLALVAALIALAFIGIKERNG